MWRNPYWCQDHWAPFQAEVEAKRLDPCAIGQRFWELGAWLYQQACAASGDQMSQAGLMAFVDNSDKPVCCRLGDHDVEVALIMLKRMSDEDYIPPRLSS